MDEATPRILPPHSAVIVTLTRQSAKKAIKHQLQRQGTRLSQVTARDLAILAESYFVNHRAELGLWAVYER